MIAGIVSALLQIFLFTLIPFVVYLIRKKTVKGFLADIGLRRSTSKANIWALLLLIPLVGPMFLLIFFNDDFMHIMTAPDSMTGLFHAMGFNIKSASLLFIAAVFKTSFAEEIFFRGFVAKRLIAISNFQIGNIIHAIIFGAIHALLFMKITHNLFFLFMIFFFPALGAYFMVFINEKLAHGSIIPGWIAHGAANLLSYSVVGFLL